MTIGCNHYFMYLAVKFMFTQQARKHLFFPFIFFPKPFNAIHLEFKENHKISPTAGTK